MQTTRQDLFDQISTILRAHAKVDVQIRPDTHIAADLAIDSVEMFDLVMEIEEAYDITLPVEEASAIDTVQSLVETVGRIANV